MLANTSQFGTDAFGRVENHSSLLLSMKEETALAVALTNISCFYTKLGMSIDADLGKLFHH